jgi:hypothetical protein
LHVRRGLPQALFDFGTMRLQRWPTITTLRTLHQAVEAIRFIGIQPRINGIRVARLEQTRASDSVRTEPVGDLQDRRTAFSHVGFRIVIAMPAQALPRSLAFDFQGA